MRGKLAGYKQWQVIVNKVFESIKSNTQLLQLVCNSSPNPYADNPPSWNEIVLKNIYPMPKEPDSVSDQKSFINIYMGNVAYADENPYYHVDRLYVEVGCHLDVWMMDNGEIRPYSMCDLIDEMFDNLNIPDMSIQKVLPDSASVIRFGDMFYGYRIVYKMTNIGGMKCG